MRLHNSYTNQTEEFKTIEDNKVKMYVCGPTVYDNAHLGHARCYITWDILYRYLKFRGFDVTYCRNVTDVDDKILKKAEKEGKTPEEVSKYWYQRFSDSMKALNNLKPDIEPFATKTLGEMMEMYISGLKNSLNMDIFQNSRQTSLKAERELKLVNRKKTRLILRSGKKMKNSDTNHLGGLADRAGIQNVLQ